VHSTLSFVVLRDEPAERRDALCRQFATEIYRDAFPNPDEAEGPDTWLPLMTTEVPAGQPFVHMILACDTGERILGGIIFEFYRESECWLATYIAVRPDERHRGIGSALIAKVVDTISKQTKDVTLFAETEMPGRLESPAEREWAWKRLNVLTSLGFSRIPIDYVQPALSSEKHPIDNLYLLLHGGQRAELAIASSRLIAFLKEFYAALHQPTSEHLSKMCDMLAKQTSLETEELLDPTLGHCTSIALRMLFFKQLADVQVKPRNPSEPKEIRVGHLRDVLDINKPLDNLLCVPIASFFNDIVTPYSVAKNLPLIVLCEPFGDEEEGTRPPRDVTINLPATFVMRWEKNRESKTSFVDQQRPATLIDSVTFFASGLLAYSVSFVFDARGESVTPLDQDLMLVLSTVAQPAGEIVRDSAPSFVFNDEENGEPSLLMDFLRARLVNLSNSCQSSPNVFSLLAKDDTFQALRNELTNFFPKGVQRGAFDGRVLVDMEILGGSRHKEVLEYARLSEMREAELNDFSKKLAGLTQNVLDYKWQDEEEIHDSLAGGLRIGSDITFVSKDIAVKFCEKSRVTSAMRYVIGGSPYWILVQLVMGHNEALLSDLSKAIDAQYPAGMIRELLDAPKRGAKGSHERSKQAVKRKMRLAHYIPNFFRYPTEQRLYRVYSKKRGLKLRQSYLVGLEAAWENAVRETSTATKEQHDDRFSSILIALGVIQIGGVLAAIAAINDVDFWYLATHLTPDAWWQAFQDLRVGVVSHLWTKEGKPPADFSTVWVLTLAIAFIIGGSVFFSMLFVEWLGRIGKRACQAVAKFARACIR
jgi:GNAT superfamily N-acetyltransferase